jgi:hypothetical protein
LALKAEDRQEPLVANPRTLQPADFPIRLFIAKPGAADRLAITAHLSDGSTLELFQGELAKVFPPAAELGTRREIIFRLATYGANTLRLQSFELKGEAIPDVNSPLLPSAK